MYASKRTIGKQGLFDKFTRKEKNQIDHHNKKNRDGRKVYAQAVKDEDGFTVNTIYHYVSGDMQPAKRVKRRLPKCIKDNNR